MDEAIKEQEYRDHMESPDRKKVVFQDLFETVEQEPQVNQLVQKVLSKREPITVVVLGSATPDNLNTISNKLAFRENSDDRIIVLDIDERAIQEHLERAGAINNLQIEVYQLDMKNTELPSNFADLVISDMTINYNQTTLENEATITEMKRICKGDKEGLILFSCVVDAQYDDSQYGVDQEKVPAEKVNIPGEFPALPDGSLMRLCWPLPYYEELLRKAGFLDIMKFDVEQGRERFSYLGVSYRRFCLTKE